MALGLELSAEQEHLNPISEDQVEKTLYNVGYVSLKDFLMKFGLMTELLSEN